VTVRIPVSQTYNRWSDGQQVNEADMNIEQLRNVNVDAGIINNHFGSGVLPNAPNQRILLDTDDLSADQVILISSNDFDGTGINTTLQPQDTVLGNQLEIELTDSDPILNGNSGAFGRLSSKILVVGLDFNSNIQYDALYFYKKEKQITRKHYTKILSVFFNDFYGNKNCSRQLGGRFVIREAKSYQLSRDVIAISQDLQPNLFFRDFKVSNISIGANPTVTLYQTLQAGIGPEYSVDGLNINTTVKRNLSLNPGDVTTKIGQKFQAITTNIQKITLLLGASRDDTAPIESRYDWSGELIISVFALQSTVSCPADIVPELAIEFDPSIDPITQFSLDQESLKDRGIVLTDVLQPVDMVFSDSILGNANSTAITKDKDRKSTRLNSSHP
jgi:hypothetical protein